MFNDLISTLLFHGGQSVGAMLRTFQLEAPARNLKPEEISELKRVFQTSLDYEKIIIKAGDSNFLTASRRAFVLGNTIYMPNKTFSWGLLVHESVHVWQHQHGGLGYIGKSLYGQYWGDGYDFAKGIDQGLIWSALNPEQQAELIQQGFEYGFFHSNDGHRFRCRASDNDRFFFNNKDYTDYLNSALIELRAGRGAP